ncbi:Uncharacterized protein YpuA, DUF1002 family [Marininema mesophilum]|uniref:Uncharacterized protein YpuA, DUF1002 family n=1 Tax=Marininema mesophilum TaxID=1048340 RepID=A0A1H2RUJ1_9BACL|nr:DUF1002 domain-containing protein [Marininema mesophilum]SDW22997.1 Uncharacterized protein YpuA, DUF1002 family [Marininema mesophilum]
MIKIKKWASIALIALLAFAAVAVPAGKASAETTGKTVVTLGADLSQDQRQSILQEMGVNSDVQTINVGISDIRKYLNTGSGNGPVPSNNNAYSSARITTMDSGNGIQVKAKNVTRVTEQMYANALVTAGVKDAQIYVTAPEPVTGTAALTGIMMAFEKATNQQISQDQRQVANDEIKQTSDLGQKVGQDKAADFMTKVKEQIAQQQPKSQEDVQNIVTNVGRDLNINLNNQDINNITNVMFQFSQLDNIDWNSLQGQLEDIKGDLQKNFQNIINSQEAQGFLDKILNYIKDFFNNLFG